MCSCDVTVWTWIRIQLVCTCAVHFFYLAKSAESEWERCDHSWLHPVPACWKAKDGIEYVVPVVN